MSNLSNVRNKGTAITLCDGVTRELRFTLNALAELEDKYGTVDAAFKKLESNSIKAIRFVIWAGLLHTEEGLTEQQVGSLIDVKCMDEIVSSLSTAMHNDLPEEGADGSASLPNE